MSAITDVAGCIEVEEVDVKFVTSFYLCIFLLVVSVNLWHVIDVDIIACEWLLVRFINKYVCFESFSMR
jgi:hypothetical protein